MGLYDTLKNAFPPRLHEKYKPISKIINNNIPEFKSEVPD
jgi:hypothetical protein